MRRLRSRRARAAITAVVGAVGGVLLGQIFSVSIKSSEVWLVVVSIFTVLCLVIFTAFIDELEDLGKGLVEAIEKWKTENSQALTGLKRSLGQTVEYQVIEDLNRRIRDIREDPVMKAVLSAQKEIFVLDLVDAAGDRPAHALSDDLARDFLEMLLQHVESTGTVEYHRICQVHDPKGQLPTAAAHYYEHLTAMCRRRADNNYRILLKVATIRHPVKFMLIDRRILMLQMNRHDRTPRRGSEAWCELLFSEVEEPLRDAFYDMWRDVDSDPSTRPLTEADIAGPVGP